jgi:hypothetical protein
MSTRTSKPVENRHNVNVPATVDALGLVKAKIANLLEEEKELKESVADLPAGSYEGKKYRMTLSDCVRQSLDMDAVRAHLSPQFIAAHTTYTDYRMTRVVARTGKNLTAVEAA